MNRKTEDSLHPGPHALFESRLAIRRIRSKKVGGLPPLPLDALKCSMLVALTRYNDC